MALAIIPDLIEGLITAGQAIGAVETIVGTGRSVLGIQSPEERDADIQHIKYIMRDVPELLELANMDKKRERYSVPTVDEINGPNYLQNHYPKIMDYEEESDHVRDLDDLIAGRVMGSGREFAIGYVPPKPHIGIAIYKNTEGPSYKVTSMGNPSLGTNGFTKRRDHLMQGPSFGYSDFNRKGGSSKGLEKKYIVDTSTRDPPTEVTSNDKLMKGPGFGYGSFKPDMRSNSRSNEMTSKHVMQRRR